MSDETGLILFGIIAGIDIGIQILLIIQRAAGILNSSWWLILIPTFIWLLPLLILMLIFLAIVLAHILNN